MAAAVSAPRRVDIVASPAAITLKNRLISEILPFWLAKGWDARRGGFQERFFFDAIPDSLAERCLRTQFLQVGALARAADFGWTEGLRLAFRGLEYLIERAWAPDGKPGFAHILAPDGAPTDLKRHVSDHAAAISALASLARVSGDAQVSGLLRLLTNVVENTLVEDEGRLIPEDFGEGPVWRAEPYLELMAALLAAHDAARTPNALERATRIRRQIETAFFEPQSGLLPVYLTSRARAPEAEPAFAVSPGLMARTTVSLRFYERMAGLSPSPLGTHLLGAALRAAAPATGFLLETIDSGGSVRDSHTRLGAQCALAQAWLAQAATGVEGAREAADALLEKIEAHFLVAPFRGGWIDRLDLQGKPAIDTVPAESLHALVRLAAVANPEG